VKSVPTVLVVIVRLEVIALVTPIAPFPRATLIIVFILVSSAVLLGLLGISLKIFLIPACVPMVPLDGHLSMLSCFLLLLKATPSLLEHLRERLQDFFRVFPLFRIVRVT
jgi:hypothetical protein